MAIVNKPKSYQHATYTRNRSGSTARALFRHPYCDLALHRTLQCRVHRRMPTGRNASFLALSHASGGPGLEQPERKAAYSIHTNTYNTWSLT